MQLPYDLKLQILINFNYNNLVKLNIHNQQFWLQWLNQKYLLNLPSNFTDDNLTTKALAAKADDLLVLLNRYNAMLSVYSFKYILLNLHLNDIEDGFENSTALGIFNVESLIYASYIGMDYNYTLTKNFNFTFQPGVNLNDGVQWSRILASKLTNIGKTNYSNVLKTITMPTTYITSTNIKIINFDADIARWLITICPDPDFTELLGLQLADMSYDNYLLNI